MKRPRNVIEPRWGVFVLRKRAERLGFVRAPDAQQAIERGIKEYGVPAMEQSRISAQREV